MILYGIFSEKIRIDLTSWPRKGQGMAKQIHVHQECRTGALFRNHRRWRSATSACSADAWV